MPGKYILSANRRNLNLDMIYKMSEQDAVQFIAEARWQSKTKQVCPECGSYNKHYYKKCRMQWLCKDCGHTFSLTSSTVFAYRKMSHKHILKLIYKFCTSVKGISSIDLGGLFGHPHMTTWLFNHKIREGLLRSRDETPLEGMIHIDGGFFGGKRRHGRIRRYNIKHKHFEAKIASKGKKKIPLNPIQKMNAYKRYKNRRIILNFRQISPVPGEGATRTIVAIARSENEKDIMALCERFVKKGSTIWTDEHRAYRKLSENYEHKSVEHSMEFMTDEGVHNNHAESFFSRLRRAELGVFHGMRPQYMLDYANEMAWREDMRKESIKTQVTELINKIFSVGESCWWRSYYQGFRRNDELTKF